LDEKRLIGYGRVRNNHGALTIFGDLEPEKFFHNARKFLMVGTFPFFEVEGYTEALIDLAEMLRGALAKEFPIAPSFWISRLQGGEFGTGLVHLSGVRFCFLVTLFIKLFKLLDGVGGRYFGATCRPVGEKEFSELGAPISEVINSDDPMPDSFKQTGKSISKKGGANMADVHGFSDIGRAKVDNDGFGLRIWFDSKGWIRAKVLSGLGDGLGRGSIVDEASSCNAGVFPIGRR
jgi:hypothetical protein